MNDTVKTILVALVTAAIAQLLLAPFVHQFYGYPTGRGDAAVSAAIGQRAPAASPAAPAPPSPDSAMTAPNIEGLPVTQARADFRDRGVVILEDGAREDLELAPGTIVQQRPLPGAPLTNMEIRVIVAKAPKGQPVPDVTGQPLGAARRTLLDAGFKVPPAKLEPSEQAPPGSVLSQEPGPGARLKAGGKVVLVVAQSATVEVPRVRGKKLARARAALEAAGLQVGSVRRQEDPELGQDTVLKQSPAPGDRVPPGTAVDLVVVAPD